MKKYFKLSWIYFLVIHLTGCDQDIDKFDNSINYIYFDLPFVLDRYGRETQQREDSIEYSFAMDPIEVTQHVFKIPVSTVGLAYNQDRSYRVEMVADSSDVTTDDWEAASIASPVIRANKLIDTLYVTVNRTPILKTTSRHIVFRILPNENFQLGTTDCQMAKISVTDVLTPPDWWKKYQGYFGEFCREKYAKWQEIYYLGADPNVDDEGNQYYWDNMPSNAMPSWYPSTFVFIRVLKQYFIDHEEYPDGDRSKPRISLP